MNAHEVDPKVVLSTCTTDRIFENLSEHTTKGREGMDGSFVLFCFICSCLQVHERTVTARQRISLIFCWDEVAAVAMAKLLSHPNNAIRQAVVQAMSVAEVEVALSAQGRECSGQNRNFPQKKQGIYTKLSRYQLLYASLLNVQRPTGVPKSLAKKSIPCMH